MTVASSCWKALLVGILICGSANAQEAAALSDQALELAGQKRLTAAEALWKQALQLDGDYFPALFNLGYLNFQRGTLPPAIDFLGRASKQDPEDFNTYYLLGLAHSQNGQRDDALRAWRVALALRPDHVRLMKIMVVEYDRERYYGEAADLAERAILVAPDDSDLFMLALTAHRNDANAIRGRELAHIAYERFPNLARASFELAWHHLQSGEFERAAELIKESIALDPDYEEPHFYLGDWLVQTSRYAEATKSLREAIKIRPDYIPARVRLAQALLRLDRIDEAEQELQEAARQNPLHPQPHVLLSRVYFRKKDLKRASAEKRLSLKLRRENPTILEAAQTRRFPD